ncbi:hypothetical protein BJV78DRAFT_1276806 [Lactifluus subvellereus]|nr:hypothetical protein BJV78DRAFT_1276806 [Lactifluus subvellereus]
MNSPEQILHDRVNLVRFVRRLEKSVNESDWSSGRRTTLWLKSQGLLQQLKHARKLLSSVELYNETQPSAKLRRRLKDIRDLLYKLDAFMLSVNERVVSEPPRLEPFLPTVPLPPPSARKADSPMVQRIAPPSDVTFGSLMEVEPSAADAELLRSAEEESSLLPLEPSLDAGAASAVLLHPKTPAPPLSSMADAASTPTPLQHRTALQEELSAQLAQMAGQLRRNAEHFSNALAVDQAVLRNAEEKIGANFDVMKQERVRLRDHRSRSLGTTCLTITSVLVVSIAFVIMLFIVRLT